MQETVKYGKKKHYDWPKIWLKILKHSTDEDDNWNESDYLLYLKT